MKNSQARQRRGWNFAPTEEAENFFAIIDQYIIKLDDNIRSCEDS